MDSDNSYSFEFGPRISWDIKGIIYRESDHILDLWIEHAVDKYYNYSFRDETPRYWTVPHGLRVTEEKRFEIVIRLVQWCEFQKIRLYVYIPLSSEELEKQYRVEGWIIERLPDGMLHASNPVTADTRDEGVFAAIRRLFGHKPK